MVYAARHLDGVHLPTLVLGLTTLVLMLLGSAFWPRAPVALLGMLGATAAVALLDLRDHGVGVIGVIPAGFPVPGVPDVSPDVVVSLLAPALGVAFVAFTDNVLTARAFADRAGHEIDAKRELLALSAANLGSGLLHGFPVSSSGSRTAIAHAVGARSQLAGVFTVLVTVLAILTARPVLAAFPTCALGAVVVYAAVRLVDLAEFRRFAAFRRSELLLAIGTTAAVLVVGVLLGVLVAALVSVLLLVVGCATYVFVGRSLRPVEAIRSRVALISSQALAERFPELCAAEARFLEEVLGAAVDRRAHILGGCGACEYHVRFDGSSRASEEST